MKLETIILWVLPMFLVNYVYAESNNGIYKIEDMSVTKEDSDCKFLGYVHNISNETFILDGMTIEMFDSNNKLIDFVNLDDAVTVPPDEKTAYKMFAPLNTSNFDHYLVKVLLGENNNISPSINTIKYFKFPCRYVMS